MTARTGERGNDVAKAKRKKRVIWFVHDDTGLRCWFWKCLEAKHEAKSSHGGEVVKFVEA